MARLNIHRSDSRTLQFLATFQRYIVSKVLFRATITDSFILPGEAIYVFCILASGGPFSTDTISTNLTFILNDVPLSSSFTWEPSRDGPPQYYYNTPVYTNTSIGSAASLPSEMHNLTVQSFSAVLFDYAIYTYVIFSENPVILSTQHLEHSASDDLVSGPASTTSVLGIPPPTASVKSAARKSGSSRTAAIVGGVVGAVVAVSAVLIEIGRAHV